MNRTRRKVGGVESYLEQLMPALVSRGDEVSFLCEFGAVNGAESMQFPADVPLWSADDSGCEQTLNALQARKPDVVFLHSPIDLELKTRLLSFAPAVFFAHNYYGTCISGSKRHAFPEARPCDKVFSPACLAHYFPRRCGGLNPVTMIQRYRSESAWLSGLRDFAAVVVASEHMATEYRKHRLGNRVHLVGYPLQITAKAVIPPLQLNKIEPLRLLFIGRMESYKGGVILLDSLPILRVKLPRTIQLTFAGDGRERGRWEEHANAIMHGNPGIEVKFAGWLSGAALQEVIESSHLLVLPSVWPEPFGLVGLEAGAYGLPTAAFDVGGIGDWLTDGVNGHLAPGDPPTAQGFANAIYNCVSNADHHADLSAGARAALAGFAMDKHVANLMPELQRVCTDLIAR